MGTSLCAHKSRHLKKRVGGGGEDDLAREGRTIHHKATSYAKSHIILLLLYK